LHATASVSFDRLLARLVQAAPEHWLVKGGFALDLRLSRMPKRAAPAGLNVALEGGQDGPVLLDANEAIHGRDWWHVIEIAPGVVTPGSWDLRPTAERMPWPPSLHGMRCLDVGTMDGFWAFELERRGAGEVVAIDLVDPERQDSPAAQRRRGSTPARRLRGGNFRVAAELLGSRAQYRDLSVYDLDPRDIGEFDLIVMGYVLQMVRDPLRGLEAVRSVCRGHLILLDTVSRPLSLIPSPLARLDARRDGSEWFVFNRRGLCKALELASFEIEVLTPFFRDHYGEPRKNEPRALGARAMHIAGIRGRSAAARARPCNLA
jgi:tRNA (mo5U34)-methyltransferase